MKLKLKLVDLNLTRLFPFLFLRFGLWTIQNHSQVLLEKSLFLSSVSLDEFQILSSYPDVVHFSRLNFPKEKANKSKHICLVCYKYLNLC